MKDENPRATAVLRIDRYITPVLTAVCSFAFFILVPFMPGSPVLPLLVAGALGVYSARSPKGALMVFYVLVYASIIWQFVGFGLLSLVGDPEGALIAFLLLAPLLVNFMSPRMSPSSLALAFLAVALMLTPYYIASVPLIAAAVVLDGLTSVAATVSTFLLTLAPLLLIDNALYYATAGASGGLPIVFSQLTYFGTEIRPALPGLNLFLTGLPQGFVSAAAPQVVTYLEQESYLMLVPLAVFAAIFAFSVSIAGILTTLKGKLQVFARLTRALELVWPLVVTTVTTAAFALLLVVLSAGDIGGYQTSLAQGPQYMSVLWMVSGSAAIGSALSFHSYLNETLATATTAKEEVTTAIGEAQRLIEELTRVMKKVGEVAPSVGLRVEERVLKEYTSHVSDIQRQVETSNSQALTTWGGEIDVRILPTLRSFPEQIRVKVVNELISIASVSDSLNSTMEHVGLETRFPRLSYDVAALETDDALTAYASFTAELRTKVLELYKRYLDAAEALDQLLDRAVSEPPVNPEALLDAHDFVTSMRLLGEEYSMSLHAEYSEELAQKVKELSDGLKGLAKSLGGAEATLAEQLVDFGDVRPLDAPRILGRAQQVIELIRTTISEAVNECEALARMVSTLMPAATVTLKFETLAELDSLKALRRKAKDLKPVLTKVTAFVAETAKAIDAHRGSTGRDEENLVVIAQYPLASRLIREASAKKSEVPISDLPFQPAAAHLYARVYAANDRSVKYNEQSEALVTVNA